MPLLTAIPIACLFLCSLRPSDGDLLRSIDAINRIPNPSTATNALPFDISGQALSVYHNGRFNVVTITDGHAVLAFGVNGENPCLCGDVVHVRGLVNRNPLLGEKGIFADWLNVTGHAPLPETDEPISTVDRMKPFGKLQGVISDVVRDEMDVNFNWIVLRTPYGDLYASASATEYPHERLAELIDAEVLLRGVVSHGPNLRRPGGLNLSLFGQGGVQVLHPPPTDPFSAPPVGPQPSVHRQRVNGHVVAIGHAFLLLRLEDGRFLQMTAANDVGGVRPGDCVTAVGFVTKDSYMLWLSGALLRHREDGKTVPLETPGDVSGADLFPRQSDRSGINAALHGKVIRVRGVLASSRDEILRDGLLRLEVSRHMLAVDTFALPAGALDSLDPGMTLDAVGVCLAQFKTDGVTSVFPAFHRFMLVPRSAADIVVIARRPWWNATKLLVVIALLVVIIFVVLVWNRSLHTLSERRGHALSLALTARVRAESRTQERTRLALELHDSISQSLTGVALQIDAATTTTPIDSDRRNAYLKTAKLLLSSCRKALQDCLWDLRSRTFEEKNLTEAISRTLAPFYNKCTILVRFNVPREMLSETTTHAVLCIVRELTANSIRHGHATRVRIAGEFKDGSVRFSVMDNGVGFDAEHAPGPRNGHFGLQGIHERVNDFNGTLCLASKPGEGTKATISLVAGQADIT